MMCQIVSSVRQLPHTLALCELFRGVVVVGITFFFTWLVLQIRQAELECNFAIIYTACNKREAYYTQQCFANQLTEPEVYLLMRVTSCFVTRFTHNCSSNKQFINCFYQAPIFSNPFYRWRFAHV